ncbi:MAG: hypothetical protein ACR2RA_04435 [Geminicoccaceae bacterium]
MTTVSQSNALVERAPALADDQEVQLSLPETTMVVVGASGLLWALLFGALNALFG